ncbi:hypothetical protein DFS33DRAFT_1455223 [Desarmillaria ectypa]|nr:hypothetical protein DFS33DRAFT_1455223 [Desarmillaria ectypa]
MYPAFYALRVSQPLCCWLCIMWVEIYLKKKKYGKVEIKMGRAPTAGEKELCSHVLAQMRKVQGQGPTKAETKEERSESYQQEGQEGGNEGED